MEPKEIKQICIEQIIEVVNSNNNGSIYRNYETFLDWFGMGKKRNFEVLKKVDSQLKRQKVTIWNGKEKLKSVSEFNRGDKITFKINDSILNGSFIESTGSRKVKHNNAGTIQIVNEDSGINLYKHQEEAIQKLQTKIIDSNKNPFAGLLVLPTGGGKTLTAAYWLAKNFIDKDKKILWIAHRHELLEQAKSTFHERLAFKDVFTNRTSFNYRIISGIHDKPIHIKQSDDIIISSKDSLNAGFGHLYKNWLKGNKEVFLVIDEAHHATAKTYRKLIHNLTSKVENFRMIGLTATPFRTAEVEQGLLSKVFPDDIIYKVDLRTLINRGILSEPIFEEEKTGYDILRELSEVEIDALNYSGIDKIGKATAKTIAENGQRNWSIVNRYTKNKEKYKQTIVFALNQDNAIALNALFKQEGIKSDYVLSSLKDQFTGVTLKKENSIIIDRFRKGELEVLINVNILTEGTDLPKVQSIFLARPTISSILMTQMVGRGLRGVKAGGTKEAYIVSFIDDWKDKVSWVNPEKLLIEDNIDFNEKDNKTREQITRLVSINKIEEFASLTNKLIDTTELEKLDFIKRIPIGIYHFSFLNQLIDDEQRAKNCEVLVYDNISQSYKDFINALSNIFADNELTEKDNLSESELNSLYHFVDDEFFYGCEKHPGYSAQDIKDILQYYAQYETEPKFIELSNLEKYDPTQVAVEILNKNLRRNEEEEYKLKLWNNNESEWIAFFGYDKRYFLNEIDLAIRKLSNPDLYKRSTIIPTDTKELRKLEDFSMDEIKLHDPKYWKHLSDKVYQNHTDDEGYYVSATNNFKSKNKLDFQIDHIISRHNKGKTVLENLQLLTRKENALKGNN
jgi:ATP-dependent helicase IRC3